MTPEMHAEEEADSQGISVQVRKLHDITTASVLGTLAMVWALAVTAVHLCTSDLSPAPDTRIVAPGALRRLPQTCVAILDAVFAFGGQENWVRCAMHCRLTVMLPDARKFSHHS